MKVSFDPKGDMTPRLRTTALRSEKTLKKDQSLLPHVLTPKYNTCVNHKPQHAGSGPKLSFSCEWQADTIVNRTELIKVSKY